jgi:hypothetical protein
MRRKSFGILGRKAQHADGRNFGQGLSSQIFGLRKYMNVLQVKFLVVDLYLRKIRFNFSVNLEHLKRFFSFI